MNQPTPSAFSQMSTQDLYHISQRIAPRQKMPEQQQPNQVIVPSMFVPGPFYYYQLPPYLALPTTTAAAAPIHYPRLATPTTAVSAQCFIPTTITTT